MLPWQIANGWLLSNRSTIIQFTAQKQELAMPLEKIRSFMTSCCRPAFHVTLVLHDLVEYNDNIGNWYQQVQIATTISHGNAGVCRNVYCSANFMIYRICLDEVAVNRNRYFGEARRCIRSVKWTLWVNREQYINLATISMCKATKILAAYVKLNHCWISILK